MGNQFEKKPRILCLHGHATSAKILEQELEIWPEFVLEMMDLVFIDAPFLVDASKLVLKFDPPNYVWYRDDDYDQASKDFGHTIAYIEEQMISLGPFDGVLGFSQGGGVAATLLGMQTKGAALTRVPRIKFVIIISGPKFGASFNIPYPKQAKDALSFPIDVPSLHIIGEKDSGIKDQLELLQVFVNPTVLFHHEGHVVPHLDVNGVKIVVAFLSQIQRTILTRKFDVQSERNVICLCSDFLGSLFCFKKGIKNKKSTRVGGLV